MHIEGVSSVLFVVEDVHRWCWELIIVWTLVMNICIATSTSIETILMGNVGVIGSSYYSIGVRLHNFLTRSWLPRCSWSDTTALRKLAVCELLIVTWSHTVILAAVKLICILTVIKVVSCESEPSYIFVRYYTSCVRWITGIGLLLLLLVFQIALNERSDSCLIATTRIRHSLHILVVNTGLGNTGCCGRLWLRLTVTTSLTVLLTWSLASTYLV